MKSISLGRDLTTGQRISIPKNAFRTHVHMPGATGKGKTTAMRAMLHQLLLDPYEPAFHLIVDFLGGLSWDLLLWMSSRYCTDEARDRLVYIEPASRHDAVMGVNPLLFEEPEDGFYRVNRATEQILRAWESQNTEAMPRLARWLFNCFWACAQLGLTISDAVHLLMPGSEYHRRLLDALPPMLQAEWQEIHRGSGAEASRVLDSTRNRLKPFFASDVLRRMFGSTRNHFDVLRFMREKRIVILNLAPYNRLTPQEQDAIAGLAVNEVLATARSLPSIVRYPTYLWLDEFQRIVGPDLEYAIPEVRQLRIHLILAHQSFSQLERADCDLTSLIWQPQTRLIFGNYGEDADLLAHELASLTFDPKRIKDEIYSLRQLQKGHRVVELSSWGTSETDAKQWSETYGRGWSTLENVARRDGSYDAVRGTGRSDVTNRSKGTGGTTSSGHNRATHQQLIAELETTLERASTTYYSFDDQRSIWGRDVRQLRAGQCLLKIVDDPKLYTVAVDDSRPGHLAWEIETLHQHLPEAIDGVERLIEANFRQTDLFVPRAVIEAEARERIDRVLRSTIQVPPVHTESAPDSGPANDPFNS